MGKYTNANTALDGFLEMDKYIKSNQQHKQGLEDQRTMGSLLDKQYLTENPGQESPNLGRMSVGTQKDYATMMRQKQQDEATRKQKIIENSISAVSMVMEGTKGLSPSVQRRAVLPVMIETLQSLKSQGLMQGFNVDEFVEGYSKADPNYIKQFNAEIKDALKATTNKAMSHDQLQQFVALKSLELSENEDMSHEEKKTVESVLDDLRKLKKPNEGKPSSRNDALLNGRVIALKKSGKLNDISEDEIRAIAAQQLVNEEDTMLTRRAKEGRAVFGVMPGGAVGLALDRSPGPNQGKSFIVNENGAKQYLTSKEAESYMINQKMETPTSGIKEMKQAAPSVIYLAQEGRDAVNAAISSLGPASSRWREFASGKIGAGDPDFRELYNYSELMKSRLTKMHFGSKGGSEIVQRFDKMIDTSKDSPENMLRTFDNIEAYAKEVANEPVLFKENPQAVYDKVFKTNKSTGTKQKAIVKQFESKSTGKTKFVYSDGTEEIK